MSLLKEKQYPYLNHLVRNYEKLSFWEIWLDLYDAGRTGEISVNQYLKATTSMTDGGRRFAVFNWWLNKVHGLGSPDPRKVKTLNFKKREYENIGK